MDMRNMNGGSLIAVLQDYLFYWFPYHGWIEEEDSEDTTRAGEPTNQME